MVRDLCRLAPAVLGIFFAVSCGSTSTSSVTAPSQTKCQVTVEGGSVSFPPQGGNGSITVSAARECSWSAQASDGWIRLSAASGQGDGAVRFAVDQNSATQARDAAIQVSNGEQIAVHQEALPPPPPPAPAPSPSPSPSPSGPAPAPSPAPDPDTGRTLEVEGEVSSLQGSCPNLQFVVSQRVIRTNAATEFRKLKCGEIRNGTDVKAKGVVQADGSILATRVEKD